MSDKTIEYEVYYLVLESKTGDLGRIKKDVEAIVTTAGGTFTGEDLTEDRKLAYEINKEIRGTYVAQRFSRVDTAALGEEEKATEGLDAIGEINKQLNLSKDIARFIIVRADELPELDVQREQIKLRSEKQEKQAKQPQTRLKQKEERVDKKLEEVLKI